MSARCCLIVLCVAGAASAACGGQGGPAANFGAASQALSAPAILLPSNVSELDNSGYGSFVAIDGNTIAVSAPAAASVYVFVSDGTSWTQQGDPLKQMDTAQEDSGGAFGPVALSGDSLMVSSPTAVVGLNAKAGAVYLFQRTGTTWAYQGLIAGGDAMGRQLGSQVAMAGPVAIASDSSFPSTTQVMTQSGSSWAQSVSLSGSVAGLSATAAFLLDQSGMESYSVSGTTLSASSTGSLAVTGGVLTGPMTADGALALGVGTTSASNSQTGRAAVFAFTASATSGWTQQGTPLGGITLPANSLSSIVLNGTTGLIGTVSDDEVFLFTNSGGAWSSATVIPDPNAYGAAFGASVAMSGGVAVVGDPKARMDPQSSGAPNVTGAAYVFTPGSNSPTAPPPVIPGDLSTLKPPAGCASPGVPIPALSAVFIAMAWARRRRRRI